MQVEKLQNIENWENMNLFKRNTKIDKTKKKEVEDFYN